MRDLIKKLVEVLGPDADLIALANRVYDVRSMIERIVDDEEGAAALFYDWDAAEKIIREAEAHSKHAQKLLPHLKKLGKDAHDMQRYIDDIIKKANSVRIREAEESDVEDDLDREDDFGHKWKASPESAVRDKQDEFKETGSELESEFAAMENAFRAFKKDHDTAFDDLPVVHWDDIKNSEAVDALEGDYEEAAGLGDAWADEVKWFRQHAEAALAVAKDLADDLPEV